MQAAFLHIKTLVISASQYQTISWNLINRPICKLHCTPSGLSYHNYVLLLHLSLCEKMAIITWHVFHFITSYTLNSLNKNPDMQLKYLASPSGLPRIINNCSRFLAHNICIVKTFAGSCDTVIMSHHWISFQQDRHCCTKS